MSSGKRITVLFLLLAAFSILPAAADDFSVEGAEPYDEKATPQWVKDARRAEIITLGSWPFTVLLTSFGYSLIQVAAHNFDASYMRNPFSTVGGEYGFSETAGIIFTSLGISVGIGVTDLLLNIAKRKKEATLNNSKQLQNITITPLETQQDRELILQNQNKEILFGNLESAVF